MRLQRPTKIYYGKVIGLTFLRATAHAALHEHKHCHSHFIYIRIVLIYRSLFGIHPLTLTVCFMPGIFCLKSLPTSFPLFEAGKYIFIHMYSGII